MPRPALPSVPLTRTSILLGLLMSPFALGVSTTAVALPALSADLGLSSGEAVWALVGYILPAAMTVAIFGRLADTRGVRHILLWSAALLAVGSVVAAASDSFATLLAGRLIQGAGAGALPVAGYGSAGALFDGARRAAALGVVTAVVSIISGSGTLIGGALTDTIGWRAVVALPALALLPMLPVIGLATVHGAAGARVDAVGAVLVAALAFALVLLLETPSIDLPALVVAGLAAVAVASAVLVARRVARRPEGFVPASVVRSRRFVLGALAGMALQSGYIALLYAAPQMLLAEHDWSATHLGLVLLPAAAAGAVTSAVTGRVASRYDPFRLSALLAAVSAAGLLLAGLGAGNPVTMTVGLALTLMGFVASQGTLVAQAPLAVAPRVRNVATGLFQLACQLGGALGSAAMAGLTDPLGLDAAVAFYAAVPASAIVLCLAAGRARAMATPASPAASAA